MRVKNKFMSIADRESEKFGWWQSIAYDFYQLVNGVTSSTPIGAFFNNLLSGVTTAVEWGKKYIKDALEWFEHGNGRYVLNMALSVLGMAGAIAGAILAFPASGVFATIVLGAAAVSAVVSIFDTWATVTEGRKAWSLNDTQPGVARYYGSTTSLSDWANKESTDATVQALASGVNTVGNVAGAISFVGGGFIKTVGKNATKIGTLDFDIIKSNFTKTFGISFDKTTKSPFSPGTLFGFGLERTEGLKKGSLLYNAETVKIVTTPAKNIVSTLQVVTSSTAVDSFPGVKDLATLVGSIRPNFSGYGKIIGWLC